MFEGHVAAQYDVIELTWQCGSVAEPSGSSKRSAVAQQLVPGQSDEPRHCTVSSDGQLAWQFADSAAMFAQHVVPVAHAFSGHPPSPTTPLELPLLPVPLLVPLDDPLEEPLLVPLDEPLEVPDDVPLEEPLEELPPPPPEDELLQAIQTMAHATMAAVPNEAETVRREDMGNLRGAWNLPRVGARVPF
jgi:hypothetical protein